MINTRTSARSAPMGTRLSHFAVLAVLVLPGMLSYLLARFRAMYTPSGCIVLSTPDVPLMINLGETGSGSGNEATCSRSYSSVSKFGSIKARIGDSEPLRPALDAVDTPRRRSSSRCCRIRPNDDA